VQRAEDEATAANDAFLQSQSSVDALRYGQAIAVNGFVFPVAGPHAYTDTFGAPRMPGTPYAHKHQGNDIFAALGTPLVACERGVVININTDFLGGQGLWVVGLSGTRYYYAHLSAYAAGLHNNQVVEAGDVIGYVGDTGNAKGGAMHLHFEIHPNGGPAIDPYPLLKAADDAAAAAATAASPG
jgi:murein DD-endopeptidase MepM/ murein hydrolase activator NlpD